MPEATVFIVGGCDSGDEPTVVDDALLREDLPAFDPDDRMSLRDLIRDHTGNDLATYDVYSAYSMLAAVHALQQIRDGAAISIAAETLDAIAISGDFEENVDYDSENVPAFRIAPVVKTKHGGYDWERSSPSTATQHNDPREQT